MNSGTSTTKKILLLVLAVVAIVIIVFIVLNKQKRAQIATNIYPTENASAASLNCLSSDLAALKNSAYPNQTVSPNTANFKIGSYKVMNNCANEPVRLRSFKVGFSQGSGYANLSNLSNVKVFSNGVQLSAAIPTVGVSNNFSLGNNGPTIAPGQSIIVDFYADFGSVTSGVVQTTLLPSGVWVNSNTSVTPRTTVGGQLITISVNVPTNACNGTPSGISVTPRGTNTATVRSGGGYQGHDLVTYTIAFNVTACGQAAYLPTVASTSTMYTKRMRYWIDQSPQVGGCNPVTQVLLDEGNVPLFITSLGNAVLPVNRTEPFKLIVTCSPIAPASGRVSLVDVPWNLSDSLSNTGWTSYPLTGNQWSTPYVAAQ